MHSLGLGALLSACLVRRRRRALVCAIVAVVLMDWSPRVPEILSAQSAITDADLERASASRTVAVRGLSGGRVTRVPLEVYVARVLAGEGEPGAPDATQEALAVAIRTFAVFNAGRHGGDGFDLCDTTHCQVPRAATASSRRAALATAGRILTYEGAAAEIFYSASCGGRSESAANVWPSANLPYLQSVADDVHDEDEPWTLDLTLDEVQRALRRAGFSGRLTGVEIAARSESGRVSRLRLAGMRPDAVAGEPFRAAIGTRELRSTAFTLTRRGRTLAFTGRGYGHGVGMCVIGAGRRARRGEDAEAILAQYYPGLEIERLGNVPSSSAAAAVRPAPPARGAVPSGTVTVRVPRGSAVSAAELERLAARAHEALSQALGTAAAPITVELHGTIDSFRGATGQPWWVSAAVSGASIALAPAAILAQREGLETALRAGMAELFVAPALADRPAWVRIGAARYFARAADSGAPRAAAGGRQERSRGQCPADIELTLAVSAAAHRDAEARAEACFARAYAAARDWRSVR